MASQPAYDFGKLKKETLGRSFVAVRENEGMVNLSWRYRSSDPLDIAFNIYRNGEKINKTPLGEATFFKDADAPHGALHYELRVAGKATGGVGKTTQYLLPEDAPPGYINIPLNIPPAGVTLAGQEYTYQANDASVGDVDGDGEY